MLYSTLIHQNHLEVIPLGIDQLDKNSLQLECELYGTSFILLVAAKYFTPHFILNDEMDIKINHFNQFTRNNIIHNML